MNNLQVIEQEDFQESRRAYIGGSDAAGVLGLSRWQTPLSVWAEKTGQIKREDISDKLPVKLGIALENTVAELFTEQTGLKVRRVNQTIFHKDYSFIGANIDRRVVGDDSVLECKTASAWKAKEWAGEEIPREYIIQVMHYLAVTGMRKAYLAVLIGNQDFIVKEIERDENALNQLIAKEVEFWNTYVIPKEMPVGSIRYNDSDTLYNLFPEASPGSSINLGDVANQLIESRNSMIQDVKSLETQIDKVENDLKAMLQQSETGKTDLWSISWKNQETKRLNTESLKKEKPEIYNQYLKATTSRVLRIKELK